MICPSCGGQHLAGHPAGWLAWQHTTTCELGQAEDATRHTDYLRTGGSHGYQRPATDAERTLLVTLGHSPVEKQMTRVSPLVPSVIRRYWDDLEMIANAPAPTPEPERSKIPDYTWTGAQLREYAGARQIELGEAVTKRDVLAVIASAGLTPQTTSSAEAD